MKTLQAPSESFLLWVLLCGFSGTQALLTSSYREPYLGAYSGGQAIGIGLILLAIFVWGIILYKRRSKKYLLLSLWPYYMLCLLPAIVYAGVLSERFGMPLVLSCAAGVLWVGHIVHKGRDCDA